jgi:hypothetical protein
LPAQVRTDQIGGEERTVVQGREAESAVAQYQTLDCRKFPLIRSATTQIGHRLVVPYVIHQCAVIDTQVPATPTPFQRAKHHIERLTDYIGQILLTSL